MKRLIEEETKRTRALMSAVIYQAIRDVLAGRRAEKRAKPDESFYVRQRRLLTVSQGRQALKWLNANDDRIDHTGFGFLATCEILGVDPAKIRRKVRDKRGLTMRYLKTYEHLYIQQARREFWPPRKKSTPSGSLADCRA